MYKKLLSPFDNTEQNAILRITDNMYIPFDEANTDYQEYLKYIAEGGTVLPAEDNS